MALHCCVLDSFYCSWTLSTQLYFIICILSAWTLFELFLDGKNVHVISKFATQRPLNLPFFKTTSPSCTTYFRGEQAVDASTEITALGWCSLFQTTFGITGFSLLFDWPCHLQDSPLIHFGPTMLRCQCWPLACWQDLRVSF
jgi:hypothetical protein